MGSLRKKFELVRKTYTEDDTPRFLARSALRAVIWEKTKGRCWYCGKLSNPFSEFAIDHVVPRCIGGSDSFENLVPCCRTCNYSKGDKTLEEYREHLTRQPSDACEKFTDSQVAWLKENGIELPPYEFYFEWRDGGQQ